MAKVNFYDGGDYASDTTGTLGVQYRVSQDWGVTGEVEFGDDAETYQIGLRRNF